MWIKQSTGLKERLVCLSEAAVRALEAWLEVRGPAGSDHVFIYRHLSLSVSYCATMAAHYYRAMDEVERRMEIREELEVQAPGSGQLLALVDALQDGALNENQRELLLALRAGIQILVEREPLAA